MGYGCITPYILWYSLSLSEFENFEAMWHWMVTFNGFIGWSFRDLLGRCLIITRNTPFGIWILWIFHGNPWIFHGKAIKIHDISHRFSMDLYAAPCCAFKIIIDKIEILITALLKWYYAAPMKMKKKNHHSINNLNLIKK